MNKYNIAAIRKELDNCIRSSAWQRFRAQLDSMLSSNELDSTKSKNDERKYGNASTECNVDQAKHELFRAVMEAKTRTSHESILHALCRKTNSHPPVPMDIIERIASVCPHFLLPTSRQSPLSIAIEKEASPLLIECLLRQDSTRKSLYALNGSGDTPILQAIRYQSNDEIIRILLRYDATRKSLLIPSRKRTRTPLFYVMNEELGRINADDIDDDLPKDLEFLLLETYKAIQIQSGRMAPTTVPQASLDNEEDYYDHVGSILDEYGNYEEYDSDDNSYEMMNDQLIEHNLQLLRAAIACSHLLHKTACKLMQLLLNRIETAQLGFADKDGNTILHHACQASDSIQFWEPNLMLRQYGPGHTQSAGRHPISLMGYLLEHSDKALLQFNSVDGATPLHVAMMTKKECGFWMPLAIASPESVRQPTVSTGQLPIHIAIHANHDHMCKQLLLGDVIESKTSTNDIPEASVRELWKLYPEAATIIDPSTRLCAFQLAAIQLEPQRDGFAQAYEMKRSPGRKQRPSTHKSKIKKNGDGADKRNSETDPSGVMSLAQLNLIYFFLRASPETISAFVHSTATPDS